MKISLLKKRHIFMTILAGIIPFVLFIIIGIILLQTGSNASAVITFIISIIPPLTIIGEIKNGIINLKVNIDAKGLTVISKKEQLTIEWKEINYLAYSKQRSIKFVSVFTREFGEIYGTNREYYDTCVISNYKPNKGHMFFEYREEIMKYYTGKIINEDMYKRK